MLQSVISKLKTGDVIHLNFVITVDRTIIFRRVIVCRIDFGQEGRCG